MGDDQLRRQFDDHLQQFIVCRIAERVNDLERNLATEEHLAISSYHTFSRTPICRLVTERTAFAIK